MPDHIRATLSCRCRCMAMLGTQVKASEVESPYKEVPRRGAKAAEASAAAKAAEARPPACPGRAPACALHHTMHGSHRAWNLRGHSEKQRI